MEEAMRATVTSARARAPGVARTRARRGRRGAPLGAVGAGCGRHRIPRGPAATWALAAAGCLAAVPASAQSPADAWIRGAWSTEEYVMTDGPTHSVRGLIFFTERDWTVLFFVMDDDGVARRGSAEGGTYTLDGERLVFRHEYNLSGGDAMAGLPAQDFRMTVRDPESVTVEPTRVTREGDVMTLHFPTGNRMTLRRR